MASPQTDEAKMGEAVNCKEFLRQDTKPGKKGKPFGLKNQNLKIPFASSACSARDTFDSGLIDKSVSRQNRNLIRLQRYDYKEKNILARYTATLDFKR